ncbi:hypothetical protein OBBRIDRAFT_887380 [Obba rivulosa]|uniref:Zn(2)-C6 fungal-type domain-containing protein n=1 Tax=Obba rivulosa TaxID=1052685 RepID=A0A8E2DNQ2_9APHY|nr:hypothetical protein OBBRIDRAFT_887380 [Obba rivulosa]
MSQPVASSSSEGGKVKQTRRRQRLSCIECTKRRQKCDRQTPCGLCTSRGVAHLCRWEPIVARPTPQRPPVTFTDAAHDTIQALSARIAALEQTISRQNNALKEQAANLGSSSASSADYPDTEAAESSGAASRRLSLDLSAFEGMPSGSGTSGSTPVTEESPRALIDFDVQVAAVALAQLSLAPRTEYVGCGTILCALHRLGTVERWRFPYARSNPMTNPFPEDAATPGRNALASELRTLVSQLPPRSVCESLLDGFFAERNWQFGLPEHWFRCSCLRTWRHLEVHCAGAACAAAGGCPGCREEVNPHWLSLLFSVLALAPDAGARRSAAFFTHAQAARRLVEDILLAVPAYEASEGAVLSCLGAALLAAYLADRGRVSEAWKLAGSAMRSAQAMGLHRDPGWRKWETMGKEESELRILAWWSVWVADRVYSFILGRPHMASKGSYDVMLLPASVYSDGSPNPHAPFQQAFIRLCEVIGEAAEKCLGINTPPYATVLEMDQKYQDWLSKLPAELQWRNAVKRSPLTYANGLDSPEGQISECNAVYQQHTLAAHFLGGLMALHRPYLTHPPPILPPPRALGAARHTLNPSRTRCIDLACELERTLCAAREFADWPRAAPAHVFQYVYFVFDGAVTLAGALAQTPPHPRVDECLARMDAAVRFLRACADAAAGSEDGEGEIARRAVRVLDTLRKAGGWGRAEEQPEASDAGAQSQTRPGSTSGGGNGMLLRVDDFGPIPSSSRLPAEVASFSMQSAFAGLASSTPQGTFIPYLSSSNMSPANPMFSEQPLSFPPVSSMASLTSEPFNQVPVAVGMQSAISRMNAQLESTLMPFEMLQGGEFELDWARFVGMSNWPMGGGDFNPPA